MVLCDSEIIYIHSITEFCTSARFDRIRSKIKTFIQGKFFTLQMRCNYYEIGAIWKWYSSAAVHTWVAKEPLHFCNAYQFKVERIDNLSRAEFQCFWKHTITYVCRWIFDWRTTLSVYFNLSEHSAHVCNHIFFVKSQQISSITVSGQSQDDFTYLPYAR